MSDIDPMELLVVDPQYLLIDSAKKNSEEALTLKALNCLLVGSSCTDDTLEIPIPRVPGEESYNEDAFEITYERYVTEPYHIGLGRTVVFDQFVLIEDYLGVANLHARQGYVSMQITREDVNQAQYIFGIDRLGRSKSIACSVYCGWDISPLSVVDSPLHLRKLGAFLDNVTKVVIQNEIEQVSNFPDIVIDYNLIDDNDAGDLDDRD